MLVKSCWCELKSETDRRMSSGKKYFLNLKRSGVRSGNNYLNFIILSREKTGMFEILMMFAIFKGNTKPYKSNMKVEFYFLPFSWCRYLHSFLNLQPQTSRLNASRSLSQISLHTGCYFVLFLPRLCSSLCIYKNLMSDTISLLRRSNIRRRKCW
jgi:hypothetical protein